MSARRIRTCTCVGFTLLEVLVALVIMTLSVGAIVSQAASLNRNGSHLMAKTYALWIAQNRLAELQLNTVRLAVSDTRGEVEFGAHTWYWTQRISDVGSGVPLRRIDVAVFTEQVKFTLNSNAVAPVVNLTGFQAVGVKE